MYCVVGSASKIAFLVSENKEGGGSKKSQIYMTSFLNDPLRIYQLIPIVAVLLCDRDPVLEHLGLFLPWALKVSVL